MVKKSLLALLCAVGLTVTPRAECFAETAITVAVAYELYSLFKTWSRDPKPNRKQRPLLDYSMKLYKKDFKQWRKNVWQNLLIIQEDYVEGQGFKDTYLKLKQGEFIKGSKARCNPFGFNGNLLSYLVFIGKTRKSMKDLSLLIFAIATLNKGGIPKALAGNKTYEKVFKFFGWENPYKNSEGNGWNVSPEAFQRLTQQQRDALLAALIA